MHPEDLNYVPLKKKCPDLREEMKSKERKYEGKHPSNSKDRQKTLEWTSTLKPDQQKKDQTDEKEGQQPTMADSRMID
uniref:Uncharacterized protein n=1 Tax=Romanomermis culicivorax TaxID=13658 RepID=A0A915KQ05_ROMCU